MITEDQLEQLCIDWFKETGYEYAYGLDIAPDGDTPERRDYRGVVLEGRLLQQLQRINPHIPLATLEQVVAQVAKPDSPVLINANKTFHQWLLEGVKVEYRDNGEEKHDYARLIDFASVQNNQFLVVNQFSIVGTKGHRRPDVVVFINGLPLAVIELKNPADNHADILKAYDQLQTYKDEIPDLFVFNEALVISDGWDARIGTLTASRERFMIWRTVKDESDKPAWEYQLETLVKGFFNPELLLDYLRFFQLFEQSGDSTIKKMAGYHQFHAVRAAVQATLIAANKRAQVSEERADYHKRVEPGSGKAGVVWHTQGSGKSISMVCYAAKLLAQPEMNNPTLVVVTDRNDLDGQLFNTFSMAADILKQTPVQADSRDTLRDILSSRQAGGIVFTTIQKFALLGEENTYPVLSSRHNIVVISDEAHRSQYGDKAKFNEKSGQFTYGYSKHLRDALPLASFIGFTGTPIDSADKDTRAVFGDYVSVYDIQDAVEDGATVPIYYESRLAKLDINQQDIEQLNAEVDEVLEDAGDDDEGTALREKTKSKWAALEKLVGSKPRVEQIAADLVQHFETRTASMPGKGMVVAMSREICVDLYDAIVALKPEWHGAPLGEPADPHKGAIKIVMTGSAADKAKLQPHIYSKDIKKLFEKRFKDVNDPLQLVIVRDMWLTGFDAPNCHTMYIDKPMKGHNLMQAIARVNRVFKDKPGGLVVDYIGIANELKQALKTYTDSRGRGKPTVDTAEAFAVFMEELDKLHGLMHGFDYSRFHEGGTVAVRLLPGVINHLAGLTGPDKERDGKRRFFDVMARLSKAFALCSTLDEALPHKAEVAFFAAVKKAWMKNASVDRRMNDDEKNSALRQIIDNAIIADGVDDIFAMVGLDKPNIGLLSPEFLEDVAQLEQKNLAVELLEKLLKDEVKARMRTDKVSEKKYSDRIMETLRKYHNRAIETAQVLEELIQMAKDMAADAELAEKSGLNAEEIAFYRALIQNEAAVRELGDNNLRELAKFVTAELRKSVTVDWYERESVRARLRNLVRRALRRWKYPPDKSDEAVDLCLQQAEALAEEWAV